MYAGVNGSPSTTLAKAITAADTTITLTDASVLPAGPGIATIGVTAEAELITYTAWALRIYMAGIFSLGFQVACQQSFMALGQAKVSLLLACLRKLILLIPLIFILPLFIQNKVFAVFLAEPISDILAAIITTSTFFRRFDKILDRR